MAWPNDWTDEEFERHTVALDLTLGRHLGPPLNSEPALDAEYVMMPLWLGAAGTGAMNQRQEREKLRRLQRLAHELSEAWRDIHDDVRHEMELLSLSIHEVEGHKSRNPLSLNILHTLDRVVDLAVPFADHIIDGAPVAGRRDLVALAVVERLRNVWSERKRLSAPKSMNEAGAFSDYMSDAFETLGLPGNPRAALDSWREFRAKHPESD